MGGGRRGRPQGWREERWESRRKMPSWVKPLFAVERSSVVGGNGEGCANYMKDTDHGQLSVQWAARALLCPSTSCLSRASIASARRSSSADLTTACVRAHAYMRSCVRVCALAGVTVIFRLPGWLWGERLTVKHLDVCREQPARHQRPLAF